jgi:hypothetical protein
LDLHSLKLEGLGKKLKIEKTHDWNYDLDSIVKQGPRISLPDTLVTDCLKGLIFCRSLINMGLLSSSDILSSLLSLQANYVDWSVEIYIMNELGLQ